MDLLAEVAEGQAGLATPAGAAGAENMQDRVQAFLTAQNTQAAPNLLTQTEDELTNPAIMRGRDNNASLVEATPDTPDTAPGGNITALTPEQPIQPRRLLTGGTPNIQTISGIAKVLDNIVSTMSSEQINNEFRWQAAAETNTAQFKDQVLTSTAKFKMFTFMRGGGNYLQPIHSLCKYWEYGAAPELNGKVIGFTGDRTEYGEPFPVVMPEVNTWRWSKVTISKDEAAMAAFYSDPANAAKFWHPTGDKEEVSLPIMMYMPSLVADWIKEERRTPFELWTFLGVLMEADDGDEPLISEELGRFLRLWALALMQPSGTREESCLTMEVAPVVNPDFAFSKWCKVHLNTIFGEKQTASHQNNQHLQGNHYPTEANGTQVIAEALRLVRELRQEAQQQNKGTTATGDGAEKEKASSSGKMYTAYQVSVIMGYCSITSVANIPPIWRLFQSSKDPEDHRSNIRSKMREWSAKNGYEIDESIFFQKDTIDDIVKVKPNPADGYATLKSAEKGVSILACLPRSPDEIESLRFEEQAAASSMGNRTYGEALKLACSDCREPPRNYRYYVVEINITLTSPSISASVAPW